jgi:preprotein translocase subunit SecD
LAHRNHAPGNYGRNLEFRLAAYNLGRFDQFSPRPEGTDVFSASQAQQIAQSGEPPLGFKWMPLSNFLIRQTRGVEPHGITRVVNGPEFLLVADQPSMVLTHAADFPVWGVKSVQITASYEFGPVVKAVEITFDSTARNMLRQFTEKYIRHSIAIVVDGQVVVNLGLLTPIRKGVLGLQFPEGEETEAEMLRDSLMK